MKTAAIIAEYNPFHRGHALHIERTRAQAGATHIVAVMSGNFVQRGDAACVDKHVRARMAVRGGADLVLELPLPWAMAGAQTFARGGVGIAAGLGCVDILSFGSECGDVERIRRAAALSESESALEQLRAGLEQGMTFAQARAQSLMSIDDDCAVLLSNPNDTLGVEYCRALEQYAPHVQPFCVKREGAAHDSQDAGDTGAPVSASYIRRLIKDGKMADIEQHMPAKAYKLLCEAADDGELPTYLSSLDRALLMVLRSMSVDQLAALPDVTEGLEHRIARCAAEISGSDAGFERLCDEIKCKRYTHARIRRVLLAALLGLTAEDSLGTPPYLRVLAMNRRGREILAAASQTENALPVITRYSQVSGLDERAQRIFRLETYAADIYGLTRPDLPPAGTDITARLTVEEDG